MYMYMHGCNVTHHVFWCKSQIWWAIGSMFGALLAYGVMGPDKLGWHWYLGLAAIPLFLVLFFFPVC